MATVTLELTPDQQVDLIDALNTRIADLREYENCDADAEIVRLEAILTKLEIK